MDATHHGWAVYAEESKPPGVAKVKTFEVRDDESLAENLVVDENVA